MTALFTLIHPSLRAAGTLIFFGLLSGCAVEQCIAWKEVPVTRSLCSTRSIHDGCEGPSATNTYTTFEKTCTARLTPDTEEAVVKTMNLSSDKHRRLSDESHQVER